MVADAERSLQIARGLQLAGRVEAAIAAYERVLGLTPAYHPAHRQLAELHVRRGDTSRAIAELSTYLAAEPLDALAHHLFVELLESRGVDVPAAHYGLTSERPDPPPRRPACADGGT